MNLKGAGTGYTILWFSEHLIADNGFLVLISFEYWLRRGCVTNEGRVCWNSVSLTDLIIGVGDFTLNDNANALVGSLVTELLTITVKEDRLSAVILE